MNTKSNLGERKGWSWQQQKLSLNSSDGHKAR